MKGQYPVTFLFSTRSGGGGRDVHPGSAKSGFAIQIPSGSRGRNRPPDFGSGRHDWQQQFNGHPAPTTLSAEHFPSPRLSSDISSKLP